MKPWTLDKLMAANRNAATVYLTLRWLAGGKRQLNTTRAKVSSVCGLHRQRISEAMTALGNAGWVKVNYGRAGIKRWYRLTIEMDFFPMTMKTTHRESKSVHENRPKGTVPYDHENRPLSLKRGTRHATSPPAVASGTAAPVQESNAAKIERERMEQIRANNLEVVKP